MDVQSIKRMGFSESIKMFMDINSALVGFKSDSAIIFNPTASNQARAEAYNRIAAFQKHFSDRAGYDNVNSFFSTAKTKLDAYMVQVPLVVPSPGSEKPATVPLKFKDHNATLLDFVNAINGKDDAKDFSVDFHLNQDWKSFHNVSWMNYNDTVRDGRGYARESGTTHNGVDWNMSDANACNADRDVHANASVSTWDQCAIAVKDTDPKGAQSKTWDDFNSFINFETKQ